ncbi:extracellular solute-binding protein [Kribbella sandramycini]|uniref:Extracellular solute-binding protein n=1 Tax=Kribbella sandramycini TaxID=60450 RepID=A0A7Y4KXY1_9ACTN|nr:extracellular solute-binding protein [Kribbella sandramycini]MBB6567693.1 multiple sugar transport system substrate-binding protein [Kribbella sandramycini]NOL39706.1 extracellular solute-binding protein [Kribbella sandramycini]
MPAISKPSTAKILAIALSSALAAGALAACTPSSGSGSGSGTVITLSGPNQWTSDTRTFGKAWDQLIADFHQANPDITVKTNVLPLSTFRDALTTQLTAGTASELIFNQVAGKPGQLLDLTPYLQKPNPYVEGSKSWISDFNQTYYNAATSKDSAGATTWVPFNLITVGIYYNSDLLAKAGVDVAQLATFGGFVKACQTLKSQGIEPVATDNGVLAPGWAGTAINSTLLTGVAQKYNVYDTSGKAGTATITTPKSWAKAILSGELKLTEEPSVAGAATTLKQWTDACASKNWSGVQAQGAFSGGIAFPGGKTAFAWGTNLSASELADKGFKYGTVTFPTIAKTDSPYASGAPAQFGIGTGGTSYSIPAYVEGAKRDAAVKFLQFVTSKKSTDWLAATGGIPSIADGQIPAAMKNLATPAWSTSPITLNGPFKSPTAKSAQSPTSGFLIGSKTLPEYLSQAQQDNEQWAKEQVSINKWTEEWSSK